MKTVFNFLVRCLRSRAVYRTLVFVLLVIFLGSGGYLAYYAYSSRQAQQEYDRLADLRQQYLDNMTDAPSEAAPTQGAGSGPEEQPDDPAAEPTILPEYQALYELNNDLVGWIYVPGTKVDYPVVQTSTDTRDYYLRRGYDGSYSRWGTVYVREECDVFAPSDNVVIYGHHMSDGSMFASLDSYKQESFWQEHQTFTFDTIYERHTYQIVAVFKTSADAGKGFSYHLFNDAASQEEFDEFWATVQSLAFYDTGIDVSYGDKLVCLSTCEYTLGNGRFVIVAKRIS